MKRLRGRNAARVGDAIDLESLSGTTRYRITALSIVEPTEGETPAAVAVR